LNFSRPLHGLHLDLASDPTDESVGYFHSSAAPTQISAYCLWVMPGSSASTKSFCFIYDSIFVHSLQKCIIREIQQSIKHEPEAFRITEKVGVRSLVLLSTFLKERYFPKVWNRIISDGEQLKAKEAASGGKS
jgi:hypothetical protein